MNTPLAPQTITALLDEYEKRALFLLNEPYTDKASDAPDWRNRVVNKYAGAAVELEHIVASTREVPPRAPVSPDEVEILKERVRRLEQENAILIDKGKPLFRILEAKAAYWERRYEKLASELTRLALRAARCDDDEYEEDERRE